MTVCSSWSTGYCYALYLTVWSLSEVTCFSCVYIMEYMMVWHSIFLRGSEGGREGGRRWGEVKKRDRVTEGGEMGDGVRNGEERAGVCGVRKVNRGWSMGEENDHYKVLYYVYTYKCIVFCNDLSCCMYSCTRCLYLQFSVYNDYWIVDVKVFQFFKHT